MASMITTDPNEGTHLLQSERATKSSTLDDQSTVQQLSSIIGKRNFWVVLAVTIITTVTAYTYYSSSEVSLSSSIYSHDIRSIPETEDAIKIEIEGKHKDKEKEDKKQKKEKEKEKIEKKNKKSKKNKKNKKKKKEEKENNHKHGSTGNKRKTYSKNVMNECENGFYSKVTLKKAYELPFASLFRDNRGQKKYEASSIFVVDNDAYAICDNSWAISKFNTKLEPFLESNIQIGDPSRVSGEDSGYEAIFFDEGDYYVVRESVLHEGINHTDHQYHAIIEKVSMGTDNYDVLETCSSEFAFEGDSKGFEGAISIRDQNNELVVLGLCEGNYCSETRKFERGNGRLVAMRYEKVDDGTGMVCRWSTIRVIPLPKSAYFRDYSDISMDTNGRVIVSSQEDSQVWIGQLTGQVADQENVEPSGLWDIDNLSFDEDQGVIYDFPKNDNCETIYCNIEGVHWLNSEMFIAVSDKMKSKGKQDYRCFDKDQSVHVFVLP